MCVAACWLQVENLPKLKTVKFEYLSSIVFEEEDRSTIILANHLLLVGFRGILNIIFSVLNLGTFLAAAVEAEEAEEAVPLNRQQFIPIHFRPLFRKRKEKLTERNLFLGSSKFSGCSSSSDYFFFQFRPFFVSATFSVNRKHPVEPFSPKSKTRNKKKETVAGVKIFLFN